MAEEIKGLIEQINREGIQAAQVKAKEIEKLAMLEAQEVIRKAKKQAEQLITGAEADIVKMEVKNKALLAQAGRDLLLSLKKAINAILEQLIIQQVQQSLTPEALFKIILELCRANGSIVKTDVIITLKEEDKIVLEQEFLSRLKETVKKGIVLKPSEEILAGFTISYDAGVSQFDFTDKALAEYIGAYLKPKLQQILEDAVSQE